MNGSRWMWLAMLSVLCSACSKRAEAGPDPSASAPASVAADIASAQAMVAQLKAAQSAAAETPLQRIDKLDYAGALALAAPEMTDTVNDDSDGAVLFAVWASKHMKWSDVAVTKDETSFALTLKDPDEARTKRMCTSGQIVQIEVQKVPGAGKISEGLLMSGAGNIYKFIAAGASGTLVEQNYARFCGVVTGKYDYSNSGGGTGHAVLLVGMFDLPENKPKKTQ